MSEVLLAIIGGSCGAAIVSGAWAFIQFMVGRKDKQNGAENAQNKALRYLMLYVIQERAKQHIREGEITFDDRRSLHHWHNLYHDELGGNGDADALMRQVDNLNLKMED